MPVVLQILFLPLITSLSYKNLRHDSRVLVCTNLSPVMVSTGLKSEFLSFISAQAAAIASSAIDKLAGGKIF